jgi:hypothetical protein
VDSFFERRQPFLATTALACPGRHAAIALAWMRAKSRPPAAHLWRRSMTPCAASKTRADVVRCSQVDETPVGR